MNEDFRKLTDRMKNEWKVRIIDLTGLNYTAIEKTFYQMERVFEDFPFLIGYISELSKRDKDIMGHRHIGHLMSAKITFNSQLYRTLCDIRDT